MEDRVLGVDVGLGVEDHGCPWTGSIGRGILNSPLFMVCL